MKKVNLSTLIKIATSSLSILFFVFISIREKNISFIIPLTVTFLLIFMKEKFKDNIFFLIFLFFYGFFSRIFFYLTSGYPYNLFFIVPFIYVLYFFKEVYLSLKELPKDLKSFYLIHTLVIFYMILLPFKLNLLDSFVLLNYYFLPLFLLLNFKNFNNRIDKILTVLFPIIVIFALLQYFGIYFFFDSFYIKNVSFYNYTSLKLGGYNRPFSTFSSVEEFSFFLVLTFLMFLVKKTKTSILYSIISFILILIFSFRTSLAVSILVFFLFLLYKKKHKISILLFLLFLIFVIFSTLFIKIDTTIYKSDSRFITILKHNIEPFTKNFETYSLKNRIFKIKNDLKKLKEKPFGQGLYLSSKVLDKNLDKNKYETTFFNLLFSGGIVFLMYFLLSTFILFKRKNLFAMLYILLFMFSNLYNFHLVLPLLIKIIIENYYGY
ncbi:MAG: hypothetical protein QME48_05000 [bacterium]|uniref:Uncharacterized protein n=2 Tax=Bacteria candidate phyla TaxID=1783234 RepID=A0A101I3U8_UNCT6|nr:MAG: hypothetical protein XD76_0713 [candidate division TA06 bacterium 32_111]KUK87899.1 MAG: hypothetical protein XE03_0418 [candidate division TA06 bacterium 34_109]MDI6700572.1 hypothetical protein [bacterium]HAF08052.1 hypothetical protein [candidate division WOR-3 bacterium]HCP16247.1 hypothetical protein [candidate division WOR-3 bacterium]